MKQETGFGIMVSPKAQQRRGRAAGLQELKKREKVRKQVLIFVTFVLLLGVSVGVCAGTYSGGTGEPNDPFRIATPNDLNDIGNHVEDFNKCFVMVNDINLADYTGTMFNIIGPNSIRPFTGIFDGNGFTIHNFTYELSGVDYVGLFGCVDDPNAEIRNLTLVSSDINAPSSDHVASLVGWLKNGRIWTSYVDEGSVSGDRNVGGLVGDKADGTVGGCRFSGSVSGHMVVGGITGDNQAGKIVETCATGTVAGWRNVGGITGDSSGTIVGCHFVGTVLATGDFVGGLVGWADSGQISDCYSAGTLEAAANAGGLIGYSSAANVSKCYSSMNASVTHYGVGGLVGIQYDGTITNCYATGNAAGDHYVGGLIGANDNTIINCYAIGAVTGNRDYGGLVGTNDWLVENSFWDVEASGEPNSAAGIGLTTAQMQTESTFTDVGWDFVEVWDIGENQTYPFLRVYPAGDLNHDGTVNFGDVAIMAGHWLEQE